MQISKIKPVPKNVHDIPAVKHDICQNKIKENEVKSECYVTHESSLKVLTKCQCTTDMHQARRFAHLFKLPDKKKTYFARKLIGYSNEQMYEVVADVKNYKDFVPFCTKSTIISQQPHQLIANLEVGFTPIFENYTSRVLLVKPKSVQALCQDGRLFTVLETSWKFKPALESNPQCCIVDFHINFEFKSLFYSKVAALFFEQLVQQMESAFIDEARRRYGKESIQTHCLDTVTT